MRQTNRAVPFTAQGASQRWLAWQSVPLGSSGATIVQAELTDWSGTIPPSLETVVHVLLPGETLAVAERDLGDGRHDTLLRSGQVCVTPAGRPGRWTWRGRVRDLNLVIPGRLLAQAADDAGLPATPDLMPVARHSAEDAVIEGLVHRMGRVGGDGAPMCAAEIDHAVALVVHWLLRRAAPTIPPLRGGLSPGAIRRVRAHVEANLHEDLAIGGLAELVGLSTPYFSHAFRRSLGEAPYQYILRRRCERACDLLDGPGAIGDIAFAVGFATQSHFTTVFKRVMGTSPAAWRRARL